MRAFRVWVTFWSALGKGAPPTMASFAFEKKERAEARMRRIAVAAHHYEVLEEEVPKGWLVIRGDEQRATRIGEPMSDWQVIANLRQWNTLCGYPMSERDVPGWKAPGTFPVLARRSSATSVEVVHASDAVRLIDAVILAHYVTGQR